ncbi:hypothetical protein ACFE04_016943 [Oxalis oulophora]
MAEVSTMACTNCNKEILTQNIDLHSAHCINNFGKCKFCTEMVPKRHAEKHYMNTHVPVTCRLCNEIVERKNYLLHKGESCLKRIVACEYCNIRLPAEDLFEHQDVCGNCKKVCNKCGRYVRLRDRVSHEYRCQGTFRSIGATEREIGSERRHHRLQSSSQKRLVIAIVLGSIAAFLGSVFIQRKADNEGVS